MSYIFTVRWLNGKDFDNLFESPREEEAHVLEIGSWEGRSTIYFLDQVILNEKSTITCVDSWLKYSQDENSLNSYSDEDAHGWQWMDPKDAEKNFLHNIKESGREESVNIMKGFSSEKLPELILKNKKYDIIYIDGNHVAASVLTDAVMSWPLLKVGGLIIFDDYKWKQDGGLYSPKLAIDSFEKIFSDYLEVHLNSYVKAFIKTK
jgi:hypothetical protein